MQELDNAAVVSGSAGSFIESKRSTGDATLATMPTPPRAKREVSGFLIGLVFLTLHCVQNVANPTRQSFLNPIGTSVEGGEVSTSSVKANLQVKYQLNIELIIFKVFGNQEQLKRIAKWTGKDVPVVVPSEADHTVVDVHERDSEDGNSEDGNSEDGTSDARCVVYILMLVFHVESINGILAVL